jgi:UDP-N-acetylmuramate: L-alanyl-gamma-D-glutamyl-meso-diaminopimelate ligase
MLQFFGRHNLVNLIGAVEVCKALGMDENNSFEAIGDFKGAAKRLELVASNEHSAVFKDFAHSPSKLKATISAVKEQFPDRTLVACLELHTYSSISKEFTAEYHRGMDKADEKVIFYDAHTFELKGRDLLDAEFLRSAFGDNSIHIFTNEKDLEQFLKSQQWKNKNLLMMSSGNFGGLDLKELSTFVTLHL